MNIELIILFAIYSVVDGIRDGYFYHFVDFRKLVSLPYNEHIAWSMMRAIILAGCLLFGMPESPIDVLPAFLMFPFLHDGAYYTTREILRKGTYPAYWFDHSKESTAKSTKILTPLVRVTLFALGLLIIFFRVK